MSAPKAGRLHVDGRFIKDAAGRTVILRGLNVSGRHKQPPFLVDDPGSLAPLRAWGMNAIRLVLVWEAIEPEPDEFDDTYLDGVAMLATAAGDLGLHVIVDLHQDIYSRAFGGSGAPAWSIAPADRPAPSAPPPAGPWFLRYVTSPPVRRSLARFWRDDDGIQGHFLRATARAAARLAEVEAIVGWDPYNEPFGGDLPVDRFEREHLQPLYERSIAAVRAVAPHWICFFEGALFSSEQGTKLDLRPRDNLVYFPHFYAKAPFAARAYDGDTRELEQVLGVYEADAARLGVPWMLGEYGFPADGRGAARYLADHERALERRRAGGTAWHWNPSDLDWNDERMSVVAPDGGETALLAPLCHPYPMAVAGELLEYGHDEAARRFTLRFRPAGGDTVVAVPRRFAPRGARVEVSAPRSLVSFDEPRLRITTPAAGAPVTVTIEA